MIITVTLNPAIDKTVEVPKLLPGKLNRIGHVEYDAGGKGINVSKTIQALGGESIATGFLGGSSGQTILKVLTENNIGCDFVEVQGETRTNTKVVEADKTLTELNEPGPVISKENLQKLEEKLLGYANADTLFVFSGSVPVGVSKSIYGDWIRLVKAKGAKTLLDADGEAFAKAVEAGPDIIKPNQAELMEYLGLSFSGPVEEMLQTDTMGIFQEKGIEQIVISLGGEGAVFLWKDSSCCGNGDILGYRMKRCPALPVKVCSTVGAGDAMVAALAYAWQKHLNMEETIKLCMAISAGAVTTVGTKPPSRETVEALYYNTNPVA
jgi:1-phosphofructokinase